MLLQTSKSKRTTRKGSSKWVRRNYIKECRKPKEVNCFTKKRVKVKVRRGRRVGWKSVLKTVRKQNKQCCFKQVKVKGRRGKAASKWVRRNDIKECRKPKQV